MANHPNRGKKARLKKMALLDPKLAEQRIKAFNDKLRTDGKTLAQYVKEQAENETAAIERTNKAANARRNNGQGYVKAV